MTTKERRPKGTGSVFPRGDTFRIRVRFNKRHYGKDGFNKRHYGKDGFRTREEAETALKTLTERLNSEKDAQAWEILDQVETPEKAIEPGDCYIIQETFTEASKVVWLVDEVWRIERQAGARADGVQLWLLERLVDGKQRIGIPQLYPFMRVDSK